jgi:hypothetical protein
LLPSPHDDVRFLLRGRDDARVVDARIDHVPGRDVRLVFLPLLDRAASFHEVAPVRKALDRLRFEVAVGHRMADHRDPQPAGPEPARDPARRLRLAAAGAHRRHRDHRHARRQHRALRPEQQEVGARRERARGEMHHVRVRNVAVGEHHLVHAEAPADAFELGFLDDRDPIGVARAGEGRRIAPPGDVRNLRGVSDD